MKYSFLAAVLIASLLLPAAMALEHGHEDTGEVTLESALWTLGSVVVVSLVSLVGIIALGIKRNTLTKVLTLLVALAAGTLLGDALLHLLPHYAEEFGFTVLTGGLVLGGVLLLFIMERVIHWHHCHQVHLCDDPHSKKDHGDHVHSFGWTVLFGDALHNLLDGALIAASYLVSIPVGIATTIAVLLHEIPQEIADYGVLLHAGFSRGKALLVNFASALTAVLGAIIVLALEHSVEFLELYLIPITAGAFIYIAGTDLLPELKDDENTQQVLIHLIAFLVGIALMAGLLLLE